MSKEFPAYKNITTKNLIPYANNARTHSAKQVQQIAESIKEFGFLNPVIVDGEKGIIAGHGRVLAAQQLGLEKLPCIEASHLTDAQRRAYVLADNQLAMNAGWDKDLLKIEITELQSLDFNIDTLGFDNAFLNGLDISRGISGKVDPDELPEITANPISKPGDVWILGNHRLVCGDSTNEDDVKACLSGSLPLLMVTDPPYGVSYNANWRNEVERASGGLIGGQAIGKVENDHNADWTKTYALFPGDVAYVWHADKFSAVVQRGLEKTGFLIRSQIIWVKSNFSISRGDYHWKHEPCWYSVRKGKKANWVGGRKQTTVWEIDKPQASETGHSTQKPIECMKKPLENNSLPGDCIYEPFSGSGTTIIACEMTDRHCRAIEINPVYVDLAIKRWQEFTGLDAVHESTSKKYRDHVYEQPTGNTKEEN